MSWTVYLSGEIHTDWRDQIIAGAQSNNLDIEFTSAVTNHEASDAAGDVLGKPYITLHADDIVHALKEVDGAAMAWAQSPDQVVEVLNYVISAK